MIIRKAKHKDLDSICKVLSEAFSETYCPTENFIWILNNDYIYTCVAEEDGKVVGCATLHILPKLLHNGSYVGLIEDVAVLRDFNGKGIGTALVNQLVSLALVEGCYKVILDCDESLIGFYEKSGFHKKEIQMRLDYY